MTAPLRLLGRRRVGQGSFLQVFRNHYAATDGRHVVRDVIDHPGAVSVVAVIGEDVLLVRQFRAALGHDLLEIPAGKLDEVGEAPERAAARELQEEAGYLPGKITLLARCYTAAGFCNEFMRIYLAEDLEEVGSAPVGVEEEHAELVRLPLSEAIRMIETGDIIDAKTQIGLLALAARRAARRETR